MSCLIDLLNHVMLTLAGKSLMRRSFMTRINMMMGPLHIIFILVVLDLHCNQVDADSYQLHNCNMRHGLLTCPSILSDDTMTIYLEDPTTQLIILRIGVKTNIQVVDFVKKISSCTHHVCRFSSL